MVADNFDTKHLEVAIGVVEVLGDRIAVEIKTVLEAQPAFDK